MIFSIDTSCDETSVAITDNHRVLGHLEYTQIQTHQQWGGVVPSLAKRAHEERIDEIILLVCKKTVQHNKPLFLSKTKNASPIDTVFNKVDHIAVTYGPGLAIALEVGIRKAIGLAKKYNKSLIRVNHMEGHAYSCFTQNKNGNPTHIFNFPYLVLLVSGAHTELLVLEDHLKFRMLGETRDDAAGEALDKAARMLGFQYPGGPVLERLANLSDKKDHYHFHRPMWDSKDLDFSFSGLKTAIFNKLRTMDEEQKSAAVKELSYAFQEAIVESILHKVEMAVQQTGITRLAVGGGVIANKYLRTKLRQLMKKHHGEVFFPPEHYLTSDNAAMIGVAAYYKVKRGEIVEDLKDLDRVPRLSLAWIKASFPVDWENAYT